MNANNDTVFLVLCHLMLAFTALFWSRNMHKYDMILSEHVFGVFAMYQVVAVGYILIY